MFDSCVRDVDPRTLLKRDKRERTGPSLAPPKELGGGNVARDLIPFFITTRFSLIFSVAFPSYTASCPWIVVREYLSTPLDLRSRAVDKICDGQYAQVVMPGHPLQNCLDLIATRSADNIHRFGTWPSVFRSPQGPLLAHCILQEDDITFYTLPTPSSPSIIE